MKTKEEILEIVCLERREEYTYGPMVRETDAIKAMQSYADQQTAELRAEVERLKEELDGMNMLYKQACDAAGSYEQRAREAENEIRHIYERPNINHP